MGVFDKIKNALFEEEYVEVEEVPKKKKIKPKKDVHKEIHKVNEEKPIARKVVLPEKKEEVTAIEDNSNEIEKTKESFKFPMMEEEDLEIESVAKYQEPKIVKVAEEDYHNDVDDKVSIEESQPYQGKAKSLYGIEDDHIKMHEYGTYEKHEEKKSFKPSPIISPIYGVLDKNYKKEEIVTKKEVRLTSSYARENISVDDVRKKAYGTLADEIEQELGYGEEPVFEPIEEEKSSFVDLTVEDEKPQVHEVTMGDAEEYFQDLGLEYNIDYKDAAKEKATGRREKAHYEDEEEEKTPVVEIKKEEQEVIVNEPKDATDGTNTNEASSDDNLFDLIDSMYEE